MTRLGFEPRTFGLWAQRATTVPSCRQCNIGKIFEQKRCDNGDINCGFLIFHFFILAKIRSTLDIHHIHKLTFHLFLVCT